MDDKRLGMSFQSCEFDGGVVHVEISQSSMRGNSSN